MKLRRPPHPSQLTLDALCFPSPRTGTNRHVTPQHGPHGRVWFAGGRWHRALRPSGWPVVEAFLAAYDGNAWKLLTKVAPDLHAAYFARRNPHREDMAAACVSGVVLAATYYDASTGRKFSTYAGPCIMSAARRFDKQARKAAAGQLSETYETAEKARVSDTEISESFDRIRELLEPCEPIERRVIMYLFCDDQTPDEVARTTGLKRSQVRAIKQSALKRMRGDY